MNEYLTLIIWCSCILILYKLFSNIKRLISEYEEELKKTDFSLNGSTKKGN